MINYSTRRLSDHASAQCHVKLFDNGDIVFTSYRTDVLYYNAKTHALICTGLYSMTTRKQIGWFLREYFPELNYHDIKRAYDRDEAIIYVSGQICCTRPYTDTELSILQMRDFTRNNIYPVGY